MALPQGKEPIYTIEDIYNLPEGQRAELIDGQIYYQASPSKTHQRISGKLFTKISNYIDLKKGRCEIYPAPFDIFLLNKDDEYECFIPDISVICNPDIIKERGCYGAPDWIIEIISPSTASNDYFTKSIKYQTAGVKEYWIVNPIRETITVYNFNEENFIPRNYTFKDKIKVNIYDDFVIDFNELNI